MERGLSREYNVCKMHVNVEMHKILVACVLDYNGRESAPDSRCMHMFLDQGT